MVLFTGCAELSLGFVGHTITCGGFESDPWGWKEKSGIVSKVYEQAYNRGCKRVLLSYKGQFVISAERIRGTEKRVYEELEAAIVDAGSWVH